jgi:DNA helicase-2/ATP-dependent DNA helicase PcrA
VFGARNYGIPSRFLSEIPAELTDREEQEARRPGTGGVGGGIRARAGSWTSRGDGAPVTPKFQLGQDVVHAAFGEGVVIGVEPGGIVVIRFSGDGTERKLVADMAPISARS